MTLKLSLYFFFLNVTHYSVFQAVEKLILIFCFSLGVGKPYFKEQIYHS